MAEHNRGKGIVENIMRSPGIVILLVTVLCVFGVYGLINMNKQEFPEFSVRLGVVAGVYPGANAEQVEEQLTEPLEDFLFSYEEVDKRNTFSVTKNGITYIYVVLDETVENDGQAWSKIRHGLKDFKATLPPGVLAISVNDDFGNTTSLLITLSSSDKNYRELGTYMGLLEDRLREVPAIGNIKRYGDCHEEIVIRLDKEKITSYGIDAKTVFATLFPQGLLSIGGSLELDGSDVPLEVTVPFTTEKEIGEQVIAFTTSGNMVRLKDIAVIERRYDNPSSYITHDGVKSLVLSVEMRSGNNIVQFGKEVNAIIDEFGNGLPDSVDMFRITDLPQVVKISVFEFLRDLMISILIVIAVMLMMFPLRSAIVAAVEIPIVTFITLAVMYVLGMELNTVTLAALIVTLGMLVDDSIVMVDAFVDNLRRGMSRWDAAVESTRSLFMPLFVATFSISAIFVPFIFTIDGYLGEFVGYFPPMIALSLFISLIMAMLLVPLMEYKMLGSKSLSGDLNLVERIQERFFAFVNRTYEFVLSKCMKYPYAAITAAVGSVALAVVIFLLSPIQLMPKAERDSFAVEIYLPEGRTLDETARVAQEFEDYLKTDRRVLSVTAFIGSGSPRFMAAYSPNLPASNYAQFIVNTRSNNDAKALIAKFKDSSFDLYPEATVRVKQLDYQASTCPIELRLCGNDRAVLEKYADTLKAFMHGMDDELVWVHSDYGQSLYTIRIDMKPEEAAKLGISRASLSSALTVLFGEIPLTTVWEDDYSVNVVLETGFGGSPSYNDLYNAMVPAAVPGVWVPLRQVADLTPDWTPAVITHYNGVPTVTVSSELREGASQPVAMKKIQKYVEEDFRKTLPEGVEIRYGGLTAINQDNGPGIILGLIASLAILFFFLMFNFKKISIALLSLASTTLCLFGAFLGLRIFGLDVSLTAVVGIVSLFGINIRNTIILFELAEELRLQKGYTAREAAFEAGKRRMRPIFLTSLTTAVGVLPMIISRSTLWMPMGVVICFGTIFAIGFVVTILPVAYWKCFNKAKSGKEETVA